MNEAARAEIEKTWARGSGMLEDKPVEPTSKKAKRPVLNVDESLDDDLAYDEEDQ